MLRVALLAGIIGAALTTAFPSTGSASVPCRDRIYNDWYKDGKIASTYPISCYRDALKHVPTDALTYSSLGDDIRSAMQGALARLHGKKNVPTQIGSGTQGSASPASQVKLKNGSSTQPSKSPNPKNGGGTATSTTVAAGSSSGSGGGVPVPIIVLGGLAAVLIAAGGIGAAMRRRHARPG